MSLFQIEQYQEMDMMKIQHKIANKNPNRLYLTWKNSINIECKMIGPQTKCFCNHRFKQHQSLNPVNKKTPCKDKSCKCMTFQYIPTHGSYDFKCLCKHSFKQHDRSTKTCHKDNNKCINNCKQFSSAWTCSCGQKYTTHVTVSQTYNQRMNNKNSVNDMDRLKKEFENNVKDGSLYKPIKQIKEDKEVKLKKYARSLQRIEFEENKEVNNNKNNMNVYNDGIQQLQ